MSRTKEFKSELYFFLNKLKAKENFNLLRFSDGELYMLIGRSYKINKFHVSVEGKFKGTLTVSDTLSLRASAHVEGEVQIGKLAVEPGATFNANCLMKGSVKELKNETPNNTSQNTSKAGQSA